MSSNAARAQKTSGLTNAGVACRVEKSRINEQRFGNGQMLYTDRHREACNLPMHVMDCAGGSRESGTHWRMIQGCENARLMRRAGLNYEAVRGASCNGAGGDEESRYEGSKANVGDQTRRLNQSSLVVAMEVRG